MNENEVVPALVVIAELLRMRVEEPDAIRDQHLRSFDEHMAGLDAFFHGDEEVDIEFSDSEDELSDLDTDDITFESSDEDPNYEN
jgi:hypothetical protein